MARTTARREFPINSPADSCCSINPTLAVHFLANSDKYRTFRHGLTHSESSSLPEYKQKHLCQQQASLRQKLSNSGWIVPFSVISVSDWRDEFAKVLVGAKRPEKWSSRQKWKYSGTRHLQKCSAQSWMRLCRSTSTFVSRNGTSYRTWFQSYSGSVQSSSTATSLTSTTTEAKSSSSAWHFASSSYRRLCLWFSR